ncbi:MAG: diacylglycerol kinase family lipid kinase [Solobacterium sp.]|nr:diacylglycerol kinase family lipid kinase [Solobacterium sp.]
MKFEIVINPNGASGAVKEAWKKVMPLFKDHTYSLHESTLTHGIEEICKELTSHLKEDLNLVVIGGDGTLNAAINGIQDFKHTRLGFIPCGSGNDFARDLDLPKAHQEIVARILEGKVRRAHDVGEIIFHTEMDVFDPMRKKIDKNEYARDYVRRFVNGAGIGFDAEICYYVETSRIKKGLNKIHLGKLVYIFEALHGILNAKRYVVRVDYESGTKEYTECLFVDGMNHRYQGGGFMFAPKADPTDQKIDLCIADHVKNIDFYRIFPYAYKGNHVKFDGVYEERDTQVRVHCAEPMWVQTDGEVHSKTTDATIRIAKDALQLLV